MSLQTAPSFGQVISFDVTGQLSTVFNPQNFLPSDIVIGTAYTARITYDPNGYSSVASSSFSASYYFVGSGMAQSLTVAANTFVNSGTGLGGIDNITVDHDVSPSVGILYESGHLLLNGAALPESGGPSSMFLTMRDNTDTAFSGVPMPTTVPDLTKLPNAQFVVQGYDPNGNYYVFNGPVSSITPVPEPGTYGAIFGAGLLLWSLYHRRNQSA